MKKVASVLLSVIFLLGCSRNSSDIDKVIYLRETLNSADKCSFSVKICADYQQESYIFWMDCVSDENGNLSFKVTSPDTIAGVTGRISDDNGRLTFDDKYLVFAPIVDSLITPVSAPWIFMDTLRSGYISGYNKDKDGSTFVFEDNYHDNTLELMMTMNNNNIPTSAEIFWQGRRTVTLVVENFTIV